MTWSRGVPDDCHDAAPFGQRTNLGTPVVRKNLGAHVLDVEGASDGVARVARFTAQQDRFDAGFRAMMGRRARLSISNIH